MRTRSLGFLALCLSLVMASAAPVPAQSVYEPKRGTAERKQIMNAVRPFAEERLGAPVQFVVETLRVSGSVGYAFLMAQRPGGGKIDMRATPEAQRFGYDPNMYPGVVAVFTKRNGRWMLDGAEVSPSEPLYGPKICATHKAVLNHGLC